MQPAHIWIIDHVGHNRKNLDGSNLENVLHRIVSREQQPSQESRIGSTFVNDINIMVKIGDSLIRCSVCNSFQ